MQGRSRRALLVGIALLGILGLGAGTQALVSGNNLSRVTFTLRQDAEGGEPAKEEHEKQQQRVLDTQIHGDASGKLRPDLYRKALADWDQVVIDASRTLPKQRGPKSVGSAAQTAAGGGVVGVQWTQIGPAPLAIDAEQNYQGDGPDAGQVPDLAIDPRNTADQVIYAAFNDGGLWKTTDGGDNWKPLTDYMPSLSTGAVELDPANPSIVYVGTGNIYNNGYFKGIGVYRSTDAGATWAQVAGNATLTAISGSRGIHDIKMPAANTLLVATNKGLFRSTDSGATFTQITVGGTTNAFISDIDLDTQNPATTVYAAVSGVGVFVSTDGGLNKTTGAEASRRSVHEFPRAQKVLEFRARVYDPRYVAVAHLEQALIGLEGAGLTLSEERLRAYGEHIRGIAEVEIDLMPLGSTEEAVRYAVLGTAMDEPVLTALRRLAHQDLGSAKFTSPAEHTTNRMKEN